MSGFDTRAVARRKAELERVTSVYGLDFRLYGGTLLEKDSDRDAAVGARQTSEPWHRAGSE